MVSITQQLKPYLIKFFPLFFCNSDGFNIDYAKNFEQMKKKILFWEVCIFHNENGVETISSKLYYSKILNTVKILILIFSHTFSYSQNKNILISG